MKNFRRNIDIESTLTLPFQYPLQNVFLTSYTKTMSNKVQVQNI